jgi:hypothetical protein
MDLSKFNGAKGTPRFDPPVLRKDRGECALSRYPGSPVRPSGSGEEFLRRCWKRSMFLRCVGTEGSR